MPGLYIHIPFCKQPCSYCNFFFTTSEELLKNGMGAIRNEAILVSKDWGQPFNSLYLGGGTPSWIGVKEFEQLMEVIGRHFKFSSNSEWTLEANPDDITPENLKAWMSGGINRLSIGIQSFDDRFLALMNRSHNAEQAINAIRIAREVGFEKFNIDLIYGIPGLSLKQWEEHIDQFLALDVRHLSAYALTVEPKTRLHQEIKKGIIQEPDEDLAAEQFLMLSSRLREKGFIHYEVSNFAMPGHEAIHNSSYWRGDSYLGIGPSAHSFKQDHRWWNVSSMIPYIKGISQQSPEVEEEFLDIATRYNEFIMTGLRTQTGVSLAELKAKFGMEYAQRFEQDIQSIKNPFLKTREGAYYLEPEGYLMADRIASDLMIV